MHKRYIYGNVYFMFWFWSAILVLLFWFYRLGLDQHHQLDWDLLFWRVSILRGAVTPVYVIVRSQKDALDLIKLAYRTLMGAWLWLPLFTLTKFLGHVCAGLRGFSLEVQHEARFYFN
jgi:hypothetical protein